MILFLTSCQVSTTVWPLYHVPEKNSLFVVQVVQWYNIHSHVKCPSPIFTLLLLMAPMPSLRKCNLLLIIKTGKMLIRSQYILDINCNEDLFNRSF